MKNNETAISDIPELKTISPSSSPRDQRIDATSEVRVFSSSDSSGSSPSDLRRRLEDLPSSNEFTLLADRVAALSRRICRKRELFLRLHGVANRIEESDEWEEEEQRAGSDSSSAASELKDPRARRRARIRLESSSYRDAKAAMLISQTTGSTGPFKITDDDDDDDDDDKSNSAEPSVERSARDSDHLRLPAIEISRKQPRHSSLSEPSSSRFPHRNNNDESRDIRCKTAFHSYRNFTPRDGASKTNLLPSVTPFSFSSVRPKKFGGYRPSSGVVLKNLSSGSESESANETSRGFSSARKIGNTIAALELSSSESKPVLAVNGSVEEKMPVVSARSDVVEPIILPNLLPSTRSLGDDLERRISQDTSRSCVVGQTNNRDGLEREEGEQRAGSESSLAVSRSKDARGRRRARIHSESSPQRDAEETLISQTGGSTGTSKITDDDTTTHDALIKTIFNERAHCEGFVMKTSDELRQVEAEYEDTRDEEEKMPRNTLALSARRFASQSAEFVTRTSCDEHVIHDEDVINAYRESKQIDSEFENIYDEREEIESYRCVTSRIQHDFNYPIDQSNLEVNSSEIINKDTLDAAGWNRLTSLCTEEAADVSYLIERVRTDAREEALSSRASEPFESEDHSPSSRAATVYLQREVLSSRRLQNDTSDGCDREMTTNVPALALNSQDISYSTSADSRERSATRPLDPRALIKALSDVSLKQERQAESGSRKCEDFYRQGENVDAELSGASVYPTKGETWRAPRSSSRKSLSRVPSRIPIRTSSSNITSSPSANKLSGYHKHSENSNKIANYEEVKFNDQSAVQRESIVQRQPDVSSSYSQIRKRDRLPRSRNEKVTNINAHSGAFAPDDEVTEYETNDYELGGLTFSNRQSPQSTPFGDHVRNKVKYLSEGRFSEKSYPRALSNKAYPSDRDYTKIDDDVRSRSDHSTSRRSADTMNVTSTTESPSLSKYKRNESLFHVESLRNAEENVTWRTEDECPSIKDEEDSEYAKDKNCYGSYNKRSERSYFFGTKERFELATGKTYDSFSTQNPQPGSPLKDAEKGVEKQQIGDDLEFNDEESNIDRSLRATDVAQLENLTYQVRRTQELANFTAGIPLPLSNLDREPKRKKKSQERFPFTISEASEVLPTEHKDTGDYQLPDESFDRTDVNGRPVEKTAYQLKMHPSITRLATSGLEDTVTDILCCVAQEKKDAKPPKSGMRAFARIFSWKLRKAPKRPNGNPTPEQTKVIYENRICQVDSKANSCSGDSSTEGARRINSDKSSNKRWIDHRAARSNPILSSGNTSKETESFRAIVREYPHRRYDRDDLWVRDIKDPTFGEKRDSKSLQEEDETDNSKESPSTDRYSVFLAKNLRSDKLSGSNIDRVDSPIGEQCDALISDRAVSSDEKGNRSIGQKNPSNFVSADEEMEEEDSTGCLCWRLCRIFAPSKYRLPIREPVSSSRTTKSDFPLRKRKK